MTLYAIEPSEFSTILALDDAYLRDALPSGGTSPTYVKECLRELGKEASFSTSINDFEMTNGLHECTDYMLWNWIPIFSQRGLDVLLRAGSSRKEFIPCTVGVENSQAFMHLPNESYDVIDLSRSTFQVVMEGNPPIYLHATKVFVKEPVLAVPGCFRVPLPKSEQVIPDIFVNASLARMWESEELTGAYFRSL
jgi:hypothetical protein